MARADRFVLLDDAQFSKGSYTNRVRILGSAGARWLTQPVSAPLGTPINEVALAVPDWTDRHLDTLRGAYRLASAFASVMPDVEAIYQALPPGQLAEVNRSLILALAERLGIGTSIRRASDIGVESRSGDDRLVAIVRALAPGGAYLSGRGGERYQDPAKFARAGLALIANDFVHPIYAQGCRDFVSGLSVLDAVFHLGWEGAAALIAD